MTWRGRILMVTFATVFGTVSWTARPYWDSWLRSEDSPRGRSAWDERRHDSLPNALHRAAIGSGIGLLCGLLGLTIKDYRNTPDRRQHWTGLEIRKKP